MERGGAFRYDEYGNPVASAPGETAGHQPYQIHVTHNKVFTLNGVIAKTALLLAAVVVSGFAAALLVPASMYMPLMLVSIVTTIGVAIWLYKSPKAAKVGAFIYAVTEGAMLGLITLNIMASYGMAIVGQAILGTVAVTVAMLALYVTRVIKVTDKFRAIIMGATLGIFVMYLFSLIASWVFGASMAFLFDSSPLSILISVGVIVVAAFNLALDFDLIERMRVNQVDKAYEWYAAFGLMVTLVWLYLEILRLLTKLQDR